MSSARHVGRIGALALALGIGIGLGSAAGTANADDSAVSNSRRAAASADAAGGPSRGPATNSPDRDEPATAPAARTRAQAKPSSSRVSEARARKSDRLDDISDGDISNGDISDDAAEDRTPDADADADVPVTSAANSPEPPARSTSLWTVLTAAWRQPGRSGTDATAGSQVTGPRKPTVDDPDIPATAPLEEPDSSPLPVHSPTAPDVPSETRTVVTIGGLGSTPEEAGDYLQGYPKSPGNTWIPLVYPAAARQSSITQGAANLDRLLRSTTGFVDVIGMSQGAQVVGEWLSSFAQDADAPEPDRMRFTLLGNPSRRLGSNPDLMGWNFRRVALTPEDTAYTVRDIAKRWDGWANWENWPNITRESGTELIRLFLGMFTDHRGYDNVDVAALMVRAVVGNTTYYVAP